MAIARPPSSFEMAVARPLAGQRYIPEIDGLRTIAFLGVLISHYIYENSLAGNFGVQLFFVISGFLITGILLDARRNAEGNFKRAHAMLRFYARRAIRLWPILYLTILVTLIVFPAARSSAGWHILQLSNIYYAHTGQWQPWPFAHLWSLNVEEQFYLLWPVFIFFLPVKRLGPGVVIVAIVGFLLRAHVSESSDFGILLPDNVFPLAAGGILAVYGRSERLRSVLNVIGPIGIAADAILLVPGFAERVPESLTLAIVFLTTASFAYVVNGASEKSLGVAGKALKSRPLVGIGRITYGSYVYHLLVLWFFLRVGLVHGYGLPRFLICTPVVFLVAWLSWHFIETPLNRFKRFLPIR